MLSQLTKTPQASQHPASTARSALHATHNCTAVSWSQPCTWLGILPAYQQCRQAAGHTPAYSSSPAQPEKACWHCSQACAFCWKGNLSAAPTPPQLRCTTATHYTADQGAVHATHNCTATGVHAAKQYLGCNTLQPSTHQAAKVKAATLQHSRFPGDHSAEY